MEGRTMKSLKLTSGTSGKLSGRRMSISTVFLGSMMIVVITTIAVIGYFWIRHEYNQFTRESNELRNQFLDEQRAMIRNEVEKVIDYIKFRRSQTEERLKASLRERVEEAHGISRNIYESYKSSLPGSEIERMVKEALRPIRFNNGRGYYFAVTLTGVEMLYPVAPQFENTNLLNLKDAKGNFVIRDEIKVIEKYGEGFVMDYWRKPNAANDMIYPKMTFVKIFKPFNWYLGTGEYMDDFERDLQNEIIERVAKVRFGNEGYIFINTYKGEQIITDGHRIAKPRNLWDLTDPNGVKVIQEERKAVNNPKGDYIYYTWNKLTKTTPSPKVSFIIGIPDWEWMIGAGIYIDDIEKVIALKRQRLQQDVQTEIAKIVIIMFSLGLCIILLARFFSLRLRRGIEAFSNFFQGAATKSITIDVSQLQFSEFEALAHAANSMIDDRIKVEQENRRLEERLQRAEKMEALGLLAGGVAHDLNNILGVIIGYSEVLLLNNEVHQTSSIRPRIVNIMEGGQRAAAIVQDLLTLARRGVPGKKVLNLNKIIGDYQNSPELEKLLSSNSSLQIKTELASDLLNISASPVQLVKTLSNLIVNASEAMPNGGILTIKTANQYLDKHLYGYDEVQDGDYVVLSVSDTGEGISATDLKHIFEPFYTKKIMGKSGTGLGLSVVWGTVKDHQGYINVQSEEGKGSTFTLYFPITRDEISEEVLPVSISEYMGKGESILVVDDVAGQRDLASEMLRKLNYNVESVPSGEAAIEYLKEHKVDLLVLDMIMSPGMDGLDTYRGALEIRPEQKAIIMSGFSETERVNAAQASGAGEYVRKPYDIEKLGLAVRHELDRNQGSR
jgi:signal transduction histidine kinase/ActR/RegA family two-component response regulator